MDTNRSLDNLKSTIKEQIDFLRKSASMYDHGDIPEAKRLATGIFNLVWDSQKNSSVLTLLGIKNLLRFHSVNSGFSDKVYFYIGLPLVSAGNGAFIYGPNLNPGKVKLPFSEWWNETILFCSGTVNFSYSKEYVITITRHQDGGAHVAKKLDPKYLALLANEGIGFTLRPGSTISNNPVYPILRQATSELLHTLDEQLDDLLSQI